MKFLKRTFLYVICPVFLFGAGFLAGTFSMDFFYPGASAEKKEAAGEEREVVYPPGEIKEAEEPAEAEGDGGKPIQEVSFGEQTLSVDTSYVLEETDIVNDTVVETTWRLPDEYVGMNREQFLAAMESYAAFPPLAEMERGFVGLEVLSFSREKVVVQMNYQYLQPSESFYLAVRDNEVVVYLEDMETIFINTGIQLKTLPQDVQTDIIQMLWVEDEESLYNFLETYSS